MHVSASHVKLAPSIASQIETKCETFEIPSTASQIETKCETFETCNITLGLALQGSGKMTTSRSSTCTWEQHWMMFERMGSNILVTQTWEHTKAEINEQCSQLTDIRRP